MPGGFNMTNTNNNIQTNIFDSIFGVVDEQAEKKKAEMETKKIKEQAEREKKMEEIRKKVDRAEKPSSKGSTTKQTFSLNEDTVICWWHRLDGEASDKIPITRYFSVEELAEGILVKKKNDETERKPIDPETLRQRMEKDFPELVKGFTEMLYMEKPNIVYPSIQAKKKGNFTSVLSSDSALPFPNKLPFSLLQEFIAVSKFFGELDLEVHADIYFAPETETFFLDFPEQRIHFYWVEVTECPYSIRERIGNSLKVAEIHSHHRMVARPSSQDNESERVPGMHYVIVGEIEKYFPSLFLRQFISEEVGHIEKDISEIFECPFFELPSFDTEKFEVICK